MQWRIVRCAGGSQTVEEVAHTLSLRAVSTSLLQVPGPAPLVVSSRSEVKVERVHFIVWVVGWGAVGCGLWCGLWCGLGVGWGVVEVGSTGRAGIHHCEGKFCSGLEEKSLASGPRHKEGGTRFHLLVSCPCAAVQCDAACSPRVQGDPRHVGATNMYQGSRKDCTPEREAPKREALIVGSALDAQRHTVPASAGAWEAFSWVVQKIADILYI